MEGHEHEPIGRGDAHAENLPDLRAAIQAKLLEGAFDVSQNSHIDAIVVSDGQHEVTHHIDREEALLLTQAAWSSGGDTTALGLADKIVRSAVKAGFDFKPEHIDITIHLQEVPAA